MNEIIQLSESKCNFILLQIIKTLSVLIININNKIILYYILSNNFINKIIKSINSEIINSNEDLLSYYVNFLKSISLKIDLTTIQFFFMYQTGSFPLLESVLTLYNHPDKMIQSVVKNILLIMLKLNSPQLIEYICSLPSLTYFCFISCRLKDTLILISKENNYENFKFLQEEIVDELIFIQDILFLRIDKINHIIINSLFYYCIMPYILNNKFNEIKLYIKLYFINALLSIIKDETFLNIFFTILFFPSITKEINDLITNFPQTPDNYFYDWSEKNNNIQLSSESLSNFVKYNYNSKIYKYFFSSDNKMFSELKKIKKQQIDDNTMKNEVDNYILNNISPKDKKNILNFYQNLSFATGIKCGMEINNENENGKCFKVIIQKLYIIYFDKSLGLKNKLIDNQIKSFLCSLIDLTNYTNNNILLLMCFIMRNIIIKNSDKISKFLLKHGKLISGSNLEEYEINKIKEINNDNALLKKILINQEFSELDDEDDDYDEDDDFDKIMEKRNKKTIINEEDNNKIKKSILMNKDYLNSFSNNYFDNIQKEVNKKNEVDNFNSINLYYYDVNLIEKFIGMLNISNNLNMIYFKCIIEIILALVSKKDGNSFIVYIFKDLLSKIEKIYLDYKNYIINIYKSNKKFNESGYNKFKRQYKIFLSLNNFDYDEIIKQGYIILNKNLINLNSFNSESYEKLIINNKKYLIETEEDLLNNNIINFFIIHDFYYILSEGNNINDIYQSNNLFINKYPLIFDELNINEQYLLCDLNSEIKYFSCRCQINKKSDISYKYFDSTILIYENQLYVGNSSSNPNYTRIVDKYQLSNCSLKYSNNVKNCINLIIKEEKNEYILIELLFSDSELLYQKMQIIKEGIDKSIINEKKKFEDYLNNLK